MKIQFKFGALLLLLSILFSSNLKYTLIYLICAAAHELGHLAAAKFLRIKISEMSFDIAGAKIVPAGQIMSYRSEFLLCAAGPLASVLLSAISMWSVIHLGAKISIPYVYSIINSDSIDKQAALLLISVFSLLQAAINLIPISDFDGGRMMNSVIVFFFGERVGQCCSKITTFIFALILWMASVYVLIRAGQGLSLFSFSLCMFLKILDTT